MSLNFISGQPIAFSEDKKTGNMKIIYVSDKKIRTRRDLEEENKDQLIGCGSCECGDCNEQCEMYPCCPDCYHQNSQ